MIKPNYSKKPIPVFATQIFQKDIEVAFEIEKEEFKKRQLEENTKNPEKAKHGSLTGTYTTNLIEGVKIYLSRRFDKGDTREWYITAYLGDVEISDGDWVLCTLNGTYYVEKDSNFKSLYEKI